MEHLLPKGRWVQHSVIAAIVALIIQVPFVILMTNVGVHSSLGGAWALFYLPAIWIFDKIGLRTASPSSTILKTALIQEIILSLIILLLLRCIYALRRN